MDRETWDEQVEGHGARWLLESAHRRPTMADDGKRIPIRLLVVGAPRSGTRHFAEVIRRSGLRVKHEGLARDGAVSCYYAVDDYWYQGSHYVPLSQLVPEHRWHIVRHPLRVIKSMSDRMPGGFWHWQEKHSGVHGGMLPEVVRSGLFWLRWNQIIEQQEFDLRFRIEDLPEVWPDLRSRLGLDCELPDVGHLGGRKREPLTWDSLEEIHPALCRAIRQKAKEYGYEDEETA